MKPNQTNPYGYKVCYREPHKKPIRHFLTYTYRQAEMAKRHYIAYPPKSRLTGRPLTKPEWVILPIKKREVRDGIWREVPFWHSEDYLKYQTKKKRRL